MCEVCKFRFIVHVFISAVDVESYMNVEVRGAVSHFGMVDVPYAMTHFDIKNIRDLATLMETLTLVIII